MSRGMAKVSGITSTRGSPALNITCPGTSQSCRVRFRSPDESLRLSLGRGRRSTRHSPIRTNRIILDPEPNELMASQAGYPPGKALARKAIPTDIRSLCRAYTGEAIRHLAAIMRQKEYSPAARVQAASVLLDRGWGKPPQAHTGEDGGDIHVVIRQIIDSAEESEPLLIEHETQTRD